MIGKKRARDIIDFVLRASGADQTEVIIYNFNSALTRFANNYIHQNVEESNTSVSVRSIFGRKMGSSVTNSLEPKKIKEAVKWSEAIARVQRENPDFDSLPRVKPSDYRKVDTYRPKTAVFSDVKRADAVRTIIDAADKRHLTTFGSVSNGLAEVAIGNSLGVFAYNASVDIFCNIVMSTDNSSGYVQSGARDLAKINFRNLADTAANKALLSANPIECPPGQYTTIFEPLAVYDLLGYLTYAFNGKIFEEGRSYLAGKLGTRVVDEKVTIVDDPFNRKGFAIPFDFEGVPKKRLVLIDRGIAKNVVYDSLTAVKARKKSTGHALIAPNPFGPVPVHMVMSGGHQSTDDLIRNTRKGVLITRLHYTNVIDPYKLTITGMTRDGTFLIEDGVLTRGLKNLRFTENVFEALNRVEGISRETELVAEEPGYGGRFGRGGVVPMLKIKDFTFTSATEF